MKAKTIQEIIESLPDPRTYWRSTIGYVVPQPPGPAVSSFPSMSVDAHGDLVVVPVTHQIVILEFRKQSYYCKKLQSWQIKREYSDRHVI